MSTNNDNSMARFLFAILQQKNLKDIDWNRVAHDPVLTQQITNGHAARMRYSRFRSSILNLEPTRRNRTSQPRSRVTKSKKEAKGKKDEIVKSESVPPSSMSPEPPLAQDSREGTATIIKQESSPYSFDYRLTPRLTPGPTSAMSHTPGLIQPRLLTPCSDGDGYSPSPSLTSSPVGDLINPQSSFDYRSSPCPERPDPMWSQVPSFPTFGATTYSFDAYENGSCEPCEHPHMHHQSAANLGLPTQSIESEGDYIVVKHEDWDQFH
ncbi:hypothetical protein F4820DRAFT_60128 [Hypoxylon rubiginosum]|uniref:Uncharacterized protein n=1 Tax=Hypoxylon rubiginosum TaxID=110542 RepID=A0ACB9ZDB7_9PEZI|nr:hypothetical protein F4820DRAFT_60128 [Hypoxylon rubiginosum]